jgi:gliding motility-associated-like protein
MKTKPISYLGAILIALICNLAKAQPSATASAISVTDCSQSSFLNTTGSIGSSNFNNANLGVYTQNSGNLILSGAQVNTSHDPLTSNVCGVHLYYNVHLQSSPAGAFTSVVLPLSEVCNGSNQFPSDGSSCSPGDQKWKLASNINLTGFGPGNYVLEVYYDVQTNNSQPAPAACGSTLLINNGGNNYKAFFSIQSPNLSSTNPSSCFGNEGSITIGGLVAGASYQLSYTDNGASVGPNAYTANGSGQIVITGLNKGFYSNFSLQINGCTTNLFTGIILSDPIYVPTFDPIPPFCEGTTAPILPTTSKNGIHGTWSPATVDNQNSGNYTFTPDINQCGVVTTLPVTVTPRTTPTFSFGSIVSICAGETVPALPSSSQNGITGVWTPAVVDNQNSGTYIFTPSGTQCATTATLSVIVSPNITPTFNFGTSLTICAGGSVPPLVQTSVNNVIGTWSPSTVSNQTSGTYTFTPFSGQCATQAIFTVIVNPNVTPTFTFGTSLTICSGGTVPSLPNTSQNGIAGSWSPSIVSNQTSGAYLFTPTPGQCATTTSFSVTVNPNITPTFSFGTSLTICAGGTVPTLPSGSQNGITGTWNPSFVDDQNSGNYTFTPDPGQCAPQTSFAVTVNPNITPAFSFGTSLTICAGGTVPSLSNTSQNGIAGTWSPTAVDNQTSGVYTFTPNGGQCVTGPVIFTVTVTPNILPLFSFGNSLTICAGGTVPNLPTTSDNSLTGSWNPSVVSNQVSGTYTFTVPGQCVTPFVYTVTVNPIVKPTFSFGTFQSICTGTSVPVLSNTSSNGITGTWNPAVVDNTVNGTYVFTPDPGQCTDTTSFKLEVNSVPTTTISEDTAVYDGAFIPSYNFITSPGAVTHWTNSDPSIGVGASGAGTVPSFVATNRGDQDIVGTITATPIIGGCSGAPQTYTIKVMPLNKDVFVPNVFTPNGDGKNDLLHVYGNYIDKVEMHIFNQWGQQIAVITDKTQGWDGKHKGTAQPIGVYVYVLKAELSTGKTVNLKGSITLLR